MASRVKALVVVGGGSLVLALGFGCHTPTLGTARIETTTARSTTTASNRSSRVVGSAVTSWQLSALAEMGRLLSRSAQVLTTTRVDQCRSDGHNLPLCEELESKATELRSMAAAAFAECRAMAAELGGSGGYPMCAEVADSGRRRVMVIRPASE
jgi:hypothetical protein